MSVARFINVLALGALVGAAVAVYRIKYESTWQAEEVARLQRSIARERTNIYMLNAEWAHLARPDRIQGLAEKHLDMTVIDTATPQRVVLQDLPVRPARQDFIGDAIASLGDVPVPIETAAQDDPIARTIEAMGLGAQQTAPPGNVGGDNRVMRTFDNVAGDPVTTGSVR